MVNITKKFLPLSLLLIGILVFYTPLFKSFKLPIPLDTVVGLYSPYRDFYSNTYPNGIPFKNFLITDPVRQTYLWKELAVDIFRTGNMPVWNPYEMTGKPLIANFQTGAFYPLNLLFLIKPFYFSWSLFILIQSLLAGLFTYLYIKNLKLNNYASFIGAISFTFSGFSIAWLEWGNIGHTALWLPLILLSIDKVFLLSDQRSKIKDQKSNIVAGYKKIIFWGLILIFSTCSSLFAGHLQTFFYLYILSICYFLIRWFEDKRKLKVLVVYLVSNLIFIAVTFIQWFPTLQFIALSARNVDQNFLTTEGWFIPYKHLIQFFAPDFFGNPSTLNYWGTWNYGEMVGYVGVIPIILSMFSLFKKNSTSIFFTLIIVVSLLFALPTGISSIPYMLHIPFVSSAQPTRLLFLVTFSLSILSAFGLQYLYERKQFRVRDFMPVFFAGIVFLLLWILVFSKADSLFVLSENAFIAKRNLFFPTFLFISGLLVIVIPILLKTKRIREISIILILLLSFIDLLRFAQKFTPFTSSEYLYPTTAALSFLENRPGIFRVAVMDKRIMPPNFFTHYKLQTIEGYDPLYLKSYAEYIAALEQGSPAASFSFNRIITPHNYKSRLFDLLNVRYVLSFDEIKSPKMKLVFAEGQTKIYENKESFERAFFVKKVLSSNNDLDELFKNNIHDTAIIGDHVGFDNIQTGTVQNINYSENVVTISTSSNNDGFLVLSDAYYPTWVATIDGNATKIYLTDHAFRGVFVPKGTHRVQFKDSLF